MKKFLTFAICIISITAMFPLWPAVAATGYQVEFFQNSAASADLEFNLGVYEIGTTEKNDQTYSEINFEGRVTVNKNGYAELPFLSASVQLTSNNNVSVEIVDTEFVEHRLADPLLPSRGTIYRNQDPATIPYEIAAESITDSWYPQNIAVNTEPYIIREMRGTNVYVYPFRYNAQKKVLRVYKNIRVRLVENNTPSINPLSDFNKKISSTMNGIYRSLFINYDTSREFEHQIAESGDILVVHTARDVEAIQPYIQWKMEKGYTVHTEEVATGTNISDLVQDAYMANNDILYVQIVGDWEDIQSNLGTPENVPVDPVLGCVVGNDNYADIIIGRFSAHSPDDVTVQVDKTINYEMGFEGIWQDKGLGLANWQGGGDDGETDFGHIDVIKENKLLPFTYTEVAELYASSSSDEPTSGEVAEVINGGISILNYCGHGSPTSWGTSGFNNNNVAALTNGDMLPFITSVACNNGTFNHYSDCFAEAWLKKENGGAIATMMSSISQPWDPPMRGQDYFNDLLIGGYDYDVNPGSGFNTYEEDQRTTFGSLVFNALVLMYAESSGPSDLETVQSWTIFGDASIQVRTDIPRQIALTNEILLCGVPFSTTITSEEGPVSNAFVTLRQGENAFSGLSDETGNVSIEHTFTPGTIALTVTGFNLETINIDAVVAPAEGPYIILENYVIVDDNNNQADYGETISLDMTLENVGNDPAIDVTAVISTIDSFISISDDTEYFAEIPAGQTVTLTGAFAFDVADNIPDQHLVEFDLEISGMPRDSWNSTFFIYVNAPNFSIGQMIIEDAAGGNGNGRLDPGETVNVLIPTTNDGHAVSPEATGIIACTSDHITIISGSYNLGQIENDTTEEALFSIEVSPEAPIGQPITFAYQVSAGNYEAISEFTVSIGLIVEDFESGDFSRFSWEHFGDNSWTVVDQNPYEGVYSVKSGSISNNQTSQLSLVVDLVGEGSISFYRKVSSENTYDFFKFYIDGQSQDQWSGEVAWSEVTYPVSIGHHTFTWSYEKDGGSIGGQDAAWLDYIIFPPIGPPAPRHLNSVMDDDVIVLTWTTPPDHTGFLGYNLYRNQELINQEPISELMYVDTDFEFGMTHCYTVKAFYLEGESGPSNESCISPILSSPLNLEGAIFGTNSVMLRWDAPEDAGIPVVDEEAAKQVSRGDRKARENKKSKVTVNTARVNGETREMTGYNVYRDYMLIGSSEINLRTYFDLEVDPGEYYYTVTAVYEAGESAHSNEVWIALDYLSVEPGDEAADLPIRFALDQNFPNPFNPSTTIQYALPTACRVSLRIYNNSGQLVQTIVDREQPAGYYQAVWNGKNQSGESVASGIYFYRLDTSLGSETPFSGKKRMALLK
ncbi:MAG: T9SS type A sorting domain-containing protein [Planctomycetes bacterium]|nr:T9SS type A sorting domain-containing protein [Planctomycetota bacterium]